MTTYTDVFGGSNIYAAELTYRAVTLSADITLNWPDEASASSEFAAKIMDVTPGGAGFVITLPPANQASTGETILLSNKGSYSFTVKDASGVTVAALTSGTVYQLYLTDNSTAAGVWQAFQFGAAISSANAASLAGTGLVAIGTLLSQSVPVSSFSSAYTANLNDRAKMLLWTGGSDTLTLTAPATLGENWFILVKNSGSGTLTVDPDGTATIDGAATLDYQPGESSIIVSDGTSFYTVGLGKTATFAFDYTSVAVGGTGDYTLAGSELNRIAYNFTGVLTGNRNIIVPATVQQYWISNATTGAYTFTVKTAAGSGVTLSSGQRAIFYCDGTNVVDADTSTISLPMQISQGGTGATSASAALINLGGTSLGIAVFQAADSAAVWSALGAQPSVEGGTF